MRLVAAKSHPAAARTVGIAPELQTALALWRGEALADYRFDEFAQLEISRLEELRVEAIEERVAADLAAGAGEDLVGELQGLVAEHPLRAWGASSWWTSSASSPVPSCGGSSR